MVVFSFGNQRKFQLRRRPLQTPHMVFVGLETSRSFQLRRRRVASSDERRAGSVLVVGAGRHVDAHPCRARGSGVRLRRQSTQLAHDGGVGRRPDSLPLLHVQRTRRRRRRGAAGERRQARRCRLIGSPVRLFHRPPGRALRPQVHSTDVILPTSTQELHHESQASTEPRASVVGRR